MLLVIDGKLFNFGDQELFLFFNDLTDSGVVDGGVYKALHHGSSFIILDIALPSFCGHPTVFAEPLLSEVAQS